MDVVMDLCGASNRGRDRDDNHDHYLIAELERSLRIRDTNLSVPNALGQSKSFGQVLVVADGIGGRIAGPRASQLVIEGILRHLGRTLATGEQEHGGTSTHSDDHLVAALQEGHRMIVREARAKRACHGMSAAATLALICWPRFHLAHVGHSRCYLYRQGWLERMTTDHTLSAVAIGAERFDEAGTTSPDHVLYNNLGGECGDYEPELSQFSLQRNDVLVLCTDGLSRNVSAAEIADVLQADDPAHVSTTRLLELARARRNSDDDATVVVAKFQSIDPASDTKALEVS